MNELACFDRRLLIKLGFLRLTGLLHFKLATMGMKNSALRAS